MTTTNPIHLYRSLLREASYLPLARCRSYVKDYIKQSFHRYQPRRDRAHLTIPDGFPQAHKGNRELTLQRQVALLKKGRSFLSILTRANQGSMKPFEKILSMTYGRTGRRRYELLDAFNSPVLTTRGLPPEERAPEPRDAKRSPHWKPPAHMEALLASQAKQEGYMLRSAKPKVKTPFQLKPATNIWGKHISERRRTNQLHEWYLNNTRGVLPPLPAQEYQELLSIATGETPMPDIPTRRPVASSPSHSLPSPWGDGTTTAAASRTEEANSIKKASTLLLRGPLGQRQERLAATSGSTSSFDRAIASNNPQGRLRFRKRFIQRRIQRTVLQQTPLAHVAEKAKRTLAFSWTDGRSHAMASKAALPNVANNQRQTKLLFG
ncbi:uncharacterized protein A1O9_05512 [Exophiala aquamarina CBS 119918]|uniref:LYR motif-containing protein Cup1-like N-terminal domain-containing protein n=1 Tax=Exophiala aquamarina CBS 119918 TaxID=1182545 RepID=A0A072PBU6_9EURO|nr:uncharacterized protein A1O9_05512 [Exophiala aquamarina CBS 119918]KEF57594.1 hypothetical protein A1O9_05512 [Exophiala aquamarina CBS 119918]